MRASRSTRKHARNDEKVESNSAHRLFTTIDCDSLQERRGRDAPQARRRLIGVRQNMGEILRWFDFDTSTIGERLTTTKIHADSLYSDV